MAIDRIALWDAINAYVVTCGGDPSKYVLGNTSRMEAVARVERVVESRGEVTSEIGRWVTGELSSNMTSASTKDFGNGVHWEERGPTGDDPSPTTPKDFGNGGRWEGHKR